MLQLINLCYLPMSFRKKAAKTSPFAFSMVHLLHRLYGVNAPAYRKNSMQCMAVIHVREGGSFFPCELFT